MLGGWQWEKKGEETVMKEHEKKREQEAGHLLRHNLFDLWFHVTVNCFSFETDKHRETE